MFRSRLLFRELFVGGLPSKITETWLVRKFFKFGQINDAMVFRDKETKRSRGCAIVGFVKDTDADAAMAEMNGKDFGQFVLRVSVSDPTKRRTQDASSPSKPAAPATSKKAPERQSGQAPKKPRSGDLQDVDDGDEPLPPQPKKK